MKTWLLVTSMLFGLFSQSLSAAEGGFDHTEWDQLLKQHVRVLQGGQTTQVDYQGFAEEKMNLNAYLDRLSDVSRSHFDTWSTAEQLAFLINAYNAWTVALILTQWPDLESIKDLGSLFRSPWSKDMVSLFGDMVSLDDIEHKMIRGSDRYQDPRIHFVVNCASIGCPALRAEAYQGQRLEVQLIDQTRLFLSDVSRNRLEDGELKLSSIFKWYKQDFEKGWSGYASLESFLLDYLAELSLDARAIQALKNGDLDIVYLDYDWALNVIP
ncbi:DUF547 domain-containing protein [Marinomonas aquiplantarum]|uniref:Uncharacterized protein DUF547 n=1 Tax=Marinomonas aquiplantarum TaxID=491951 RepID=A0A366D7W3_9GAMM|nr:DUF547 domain-containing protein [Marinomonas aquiplantarum]RBO86137.1 uncharacterized protein DUF547 [Marinomonas aquiplantarum]